jgi:hypothetical protein
MWDSEAKRGREDDLGVKLPRRVTRNVRIVEK